MGSNHALSYRAEAQIGGVWQSFPGLLHVSTRTETGGGASPFAFGGASLPAATIETTLAGPAAGWARAPLRVYQSVAIDGAAAVEELAFTGILLASDPADAGYRFTAGGWDQRVARTRVRTPLRYRRPIATRTTATSVEDPAAPGYAGGLLNQIFWASGGRPDAQRASHPGAAFTYACDGTSVAPEWGWVDGENAWSEALALAEAAGGQVYLDSQGVMRYVNPLSLAEVVAGAPVIADTGPQAAGRVLYDGRLRRSLDLAAAYNVAVCNYQRRTLQPRQQVYEARYPLPPIPAGAVVDRELAMQWPVLWRDLASGAADYAITVTAIRTDGSPLSPAVAVLSESAQILEVRVTNPLAEPIQVASITVEGRPLGVLEEGTARYAGPRFDANGAEDVERRLPDSVYTQAQAAAERRCRLAVTFDGVPRATYQITGCPYLPGVHVGGYARLYSARYGLSDLPVRILDRELAGDGRRMDLRVADVSGLPRLSDLWVVGQAYADTDVRRLGL